jgi:hypothetical protein
MPRSAEVMAVSIELRVCNVDASPTNFVQTCLTRRAASVTILIVEILV